MEYGEHLESLRSDLHGRLRRRLGADGADDIVQEAFLFSLRRPPLESSDFPGWLRLIARNLAIRHRQREDNRLDRERAVAAHEVYWPATPEEESGALHEVLRQLDGLSEPYREVLRLRYMEGLEIEEIARRLGRPRGTVGSQIKRGLDRLRERLGARPPRAREVSALAFLRPRFARSLSPARWGALATVAAACLCLYFGLRSGDASQSKPGAQAPALGAYALGTDEARVGRPLRAVGRTPPVPLAPEVNAAAAVLDPQSDREGARWLTSVRGVVLDVDGEPIAGAAVRVGQQEEEGRVAALTDAAGRFELADLDGRLWLWAEDEERRPSFRHRVSTVDPRAELILQSGDRIGASLGRVLTDAGVPVSGASVTVQALAGPSVGEQGTLQSPYFRRAFRTAHDGTFPLATDAKGQCQLVVLSDAWPPARFEVREASTHDFYLPRGGTVEGRVLTSDGRPLAGSRLRLVLPVPFPPQDCVTNGQGDFRFDRVPDGSHEIVLLDALPDGTSLHATGVLGDSWRELRVTLANTLRGSVARHGEPLAAWIVEIEREDTILFPIHRRVHTDAEGRFCIPSCPANTRYVVRLWDPDGARVVSSKRVEFDGVELSVVADEQGDATSGLMGTVTAVRPGGVPIFVELWSRMLFRRWEASVDPDSGAFAFEGLPPGMVSLRAWTRDCGPVQLDYLELRPGVIERFEEMIPEPGSLRVHVDLPADVDASRLIVMVPSPVPQSGKPMGVRYLQPEPSRLDFQVTLPPGAHQYQVWIDQTCCEIRPVSIESGRVRDETVVIPPLVSCKLLLSRPLEEREQFQLVARGGLEKRTRLGGAAKGDETRFSVLLPVDTTEIEVLSTSGSRGVWRGRLSPGPDPVELRITLDESGSSEVEEFLPRSRPRDQAVSASPSR